MSVVVVFVVVWAVLILVWVGLDWLGNPNRGPFNPQKERRDRGEGESRSERRRDRRDREDAAVRTVLRDRYGRSSLRLVWSEENEAAAIESDDDALSHHHTAAGLEAIAVGTRCEPDAEAAPPKRAGWTVGDDPLAPTHRGTSPAAGTVRTRVWKNLARAAQDSSTPWGDENAERMRAGKAPRRSNPITGRIELAAVDPETARVSWPDEPVDPWAGEGS